MGGPARVTRFVSNTRVPRCRVLVMACPHSCRVVVWSVEVVGPWPSLFGCHIILTLSKNMLVFSRYDIETLGLLYGLALARLSHANITIIL